MISFLAWIAFSCLTRLSVAADFQTSSTRNIAIKKSIQTEEHLEYSVFQLFPNLEKDPMLNFEASVPASASPMERSHLIQKLSKQISLTPAFTSAWNYTSTKEENLHCTKSYQVDSSSSYLTLCDSRNTLILMRVRHYETTVENLGNFTVDQNEEIHTVDTNFKNNWVEPDQLIGLSVFVLVKMNGVISEQNTTHFKIVVLKLEQDELKENKSKLRLNSSIVFEYELSGAESKADLKYYPEILGSGAPGLIVFPRYKYFNSSGKDSIQSPAELILFKIEEHTNTIALKEFYSEALSKKSPKQPKQIFQNPLSKNCIFGRIEVFMSYIWMICIEQLNQPNQQRLNLLICDLGSEIESFHCSEPYKISDFIIGESSSDLKALVYFYSHLTVDPFHAGFFDKVELHILTRNAAFKLTYILSGEDWMKKPAKINMGIYEESIAKVDSAEFEKRNLFFIVRPEGMESTSRHYLMEFIADRNSTRIYQTFEMQADFVVILFNQIESVFDFLLLQKYNPVSKTTTYSEFFYNFELLTIKPDKNLIEFQSKVGKLDFSVSAVCGGQITYTYQFNITVFEYFDIVVFRDVMPILKYYRDGINKTLYTPLPLDAFLSVGTNPSVNFIEKKKCHQKTTNPADYQPCITVEKLKEESKSKVPVSFSYGTFKTRESERMIRQVQVAFIKRFNDFILFGFQNSTFRICQANYKDAFKRGIEFNCFLNDQMIPEHYQIDTFFVYKQRLATFYSTVAFTKIDSNHTGYLIIARRFHDDFRLETDLNIDYHRGSEVGEKFSKAIVLNFKVKSSTELTLHGVFKSVLVHRGAKNVFASIEMPMVDWYSKADTYLYYNLTIRILMNAELSGSKVIYAKALSSKEYGIVELEDTSMNYKIKTYLLENDTWFSEVYYIEISKDEADVLAVMNNKCLIYEREKSELRILSLASTIKLNDPKTVIDQFYVGKLSPPGMNSEFEAIVVDIINDQGLIIFCWINLEPVADSETGPKSTQKALMLTIYDFRSEDENPLQRLLYHRTVTNLTDETQVEHIKIFHFFQLEENNKNCFIISFIQNDTYAMAFSLYPNKYMISANIPQIRDRVVPMAVNMQKRKFMNDSTHSIFNMLLVGIEYDSSLAVLPRPIKRNLVKILENKQGDFFTLKLNNVLSKGSPVIGYSSINKNVNHHHQESEVALFRILPIVTKSGDYKELSGLAKSTEEYSLSIQSSNLIVAYTSHRYFAFKLHQDSHQVLFASTLRPIASPIVSISSSEVTAQTLKQSSESDQSVTVIFALTKGSFTKNDLEVTIVDYSKGSEIRAKQETALEFCRSSFFNVFFIRSTDKSLIFSFQYAREEVNGTLWIVTELELTPNVSTGTGQETLTEDLLQGFTITKIEGKHRETLPLKLIAKRKLGMIKPSHFSTLTYFFFENSGQVGLLYIGRTTPAVFGYYGFSDSCILQDDSSVSCRIFEQDMDIGCIVQCDQTRIESFRLRIKVDEIEGGGYHDELSGVEVISLEGYKIPVNYTVLHLIKGENIDFVIVQKDDEVVNDMPKKYLLFYNPQTSLIEYRMSEEEICKVSSISAKCELTKTFIYQINPNKVIIAPPYTELSKLMYDRRQVPLLEFNRDKLQKLENLQGYSLKVDGLSNSIEIPLDDMFIFKEPSLTWIYILGGIFTFVTLFVIFLLVLYKNWRADEDEDASKENLMSNKRSSQETKDLALQSSFLDENSK